MSPESPMRPDYTYLDPVLSLWQSAAAVTPWLASISEETVQTTNPLMVPVPEIAVSARTGEDETPSITLESVVSDVVDCAQVAKTFLWAEIKGDKELAAKCQAELKKSVCDAAGWATCVTNYLKFKARASLSRTSLARILSSVSREIFELPSSETGERVRPRRPIFCARSKRNRPMYWSISRHLLLLYTP